MKKVYDGIIGLAIGDAMGVPFEFKSRQEREQKGLLQNSCYIQDMVFRTL